MWSMHYILRLYTACLNKKNEFETVKKNDYILIIPTILTSDWEARSFKKLGKINGCDELNLVCENM